MEQKFDNGTTFQCHKKRLSLCYDRERQLKRFLLMPKDFSYDELIKLLKSFGFEKRAAGKTSGSRVRFVNPEFPEYPVLFHKPHPGNTIKLYVLKNVLTVLFECDLLKHEDYEKDKDYQE